MKRISALILFLTVFGACSSSDEPRQTSEIITPTPDPTDETPENPVSENPIQTGNIKYLALGDSYTIGQNVCASCNFPSQLKAALESHITGQVNLEIIATTGWTTTNLINAIATAAPSTDHDLVTLLIGVNNQYQHKPFSLYESEFPFLVEKAITFAGGDKDNVIVVSIPDYAYTPYGQGPNMSTISSEIAQYNSFAMNYCASHDIAFVNITDITQNGLNDPSLVTTDGLHPSESAYAQFVVRLLPVALQMLQ